MIEKAREATTSQPKLDHVERTAIKFVTPLVDICLIPWAIFNASALQLGFYIFGNPALDTHGVHAPHVSGCLVVRMFDHGTSGAASGDSHVRCHRPTQLVSGSINAIIPSKYVEVHD